MKKQNIIQHKLKCPNCEKETLFYVFKANRQTECSACNFKQIFNKKDFKGLMINISLSQNHPNILEQYQTSLAAFLSDRKTLKEPEAED